MTSQRPLHLSTVLAALIVTGIIIAYTVNLTPVTAQQQQQQDAAESNDAQPLHVHDVSLAQARAIVNAAQQQAEQMDLDMNIAVVDRGGNLKAFRRMDGAWRGSIDIAIKKAKTARFFDMPTGDIGELSQPGGPLYNIEHSNDGLITFPGGVPLTSAEGEVIGAVGVSGSTVENDHTVATAGAQALR